MRVRLTVGLAGVLGASVALLALSGCTVKEADEGAAGSGGGSAGTSAGGGAAGNTAGGAAGAATGGSAGSTAGGSAGSTAGGSAGSGETDICAGIPTSGKCEGNKVVLCQQPPPGAEGNPTVVTNDCGANYTCTDDPTGAFCKLKTACVPGETRCTGDNKAVEVCKADGSGFAATPCPAQESCTSIPGKAASCEAQPQAGGTATETLSGCITFERKGLTTTGPTSISVEPAVLQFVAVYNGDEYIGYAITGAADGCFEAELTKPATADTTVYVFAMDFDPATNQPLVAVAHYPGDDGQSLPKSSSEYWNWSNKQDGCGDGLKAAVVPNKNGAGKHVLGSVDHDNDPDKRPDMLIPEVCGSGAVRIFQWTRFGMVRLGADHYGLETFAGGGKQRDIVTATEQLKQDSIAVYWEKGKDVACGACFSNKGNGPFHVDPAGDIDDLYDTAIYISGTEANPTQWSYSVLSHELGHWTMANYSLSPGEGGPHYVGQASKAGLAYSEGWATAFGQWNSSFAGDWDPVYIDVQDGTTFHVDIEKGTYSGGNLVRPNKEDGLTQPINENVVAGMIFKLNADSTGATKNITGGQGLGPDALFKAFIGPRVKNNSLGRGYSRVDLVDFFDSARCAESIPNANISAVSDEVTYPWDSNPKCN